MTLERSGFVSLPRGAQARLRPCRHLARCSADGCSSPHRSRPRRRHRLREPFLPAFHRRSPESPAFSSTRSTTSSSRRIAHRRASASFAARMRRSSGGSRSDRIRTGWRSTEPAAPLRLQPRGAARRGLHRLGRRRRVDERRSRDRPPRTAEVGGIRRGERSRITPTSAIRLRSCGSIPPAPRSSARSTSRVAGPHGLWIAGGRLYCAAEAASLVVLDRDSGALETSLPLPGVPDVVWFDAVRGRRLFVAVGDPGTVTVVDTVSAMAVETFETEPGAHTLDVGRGPRDPVRVLPGELRRCPLQRGAGSST